MKNFKRVLSLALAALMVIGGLVITPVDAKAATANHVVIHEIYGAGGNSGAIYTHDYILLYNPTNSDVSLDGWSVQYSGADKNIADTTNITVLSGTIAAKEYYLIKCASGGNNGTALPLTASCTGTINLAGKNGIVVLAKQTTAVSGKDDAHIIDLVGFGTAKTFEGTKAPAPATDKCIVRKVLGEDTDDNGADFEAKALTADYLNKYAGKIAAPPVTYETTQEVMEAAKALANGRTLGSQTVEGKVTQIKEAFNGHYGNITVEIKVDGYEGYPITCNRLKDGAINSILVGDTIKVKGTVNKDAEGVLSMANGCQLITYTPATGHTAVPDLTDPTPEQIVNAAYALPAGQSLKKDWAVDAVIVGEITSTNSKYTFNIQIGDLTEKLILVYELKNAKSGVDISTFKAGDTINISGTWTNYVNESGAETIAITGGYANSHTPKNTGSGEGGSGSGEGGSGSGNGGSGSATTITIGDALAAAKGTECTVKGVVTFVSGKTIYIQDSKNGIGLYCSNAPEGIKVGDTIEGTGKKDTFNGLPQLGNAKVTKLDEKSTLTPKKTTIGALTKEDIGKYVKIEGLEVVSIGDDNTVTLTDGTKEIQIHKAAIDKDAIKKGDKVNVLAAVGIYNDNLQLRNSVASEISLVTNDKIEAAGDFNMALPLVLVLMGGAVVIFASKKKFA